MSGYCIAVSKQRQDCVYYRYVATVPGLTWVRDKEDKRRSSLAWYASWTWRRLRVWGPRGVWSCFASAFFQTQLWSCVRQLSRTMALHLWTALQGILRTFRKKKGWRTSPSHWLRPKYLLLYHICPLSNLSFPLWLYCWQHRTAHRYDLPHFVVVTNQTPVYFFDDWEVRSCVKADQRLLQCSSLGHSRAVTGDYWFVWSILWSHLDWTYIAESSSTIKGTPDIVQHIFAESGFVVGGKSGKIVKETDRCYLM
jgi:hypothetical protein